MIQLMPFRYLLLSALFALLTTGCGSSIMTRANSAATFDNDQAVVTFLRPTFFGGAIKFGIWDSEQFVGVLTAGSSIDYVTSPGEHLFLARAENWSLVKADLEAGKHYYIVGRVFPGVWKARIALDPVTKDDGTTDEQLDKWVRDANPITVIPEKIEDYAGPRREHVRQAIAEYQSGASKFEILQAPDGR